jgi:hypothetical protein
MATTEQTIWYFYKVRWGFHEEFLELWRRNHYPVLQAQLGARFTAVTAYEPKYHGDGRADWTFVVAITYPDMAAALTHVDESEIARRLFPDHERFKREEQRRFELLDAHWDVALKTVTL